MFLYSVRSFTAQTDRHCSTDVNKQQEAQTLPTEPCMVQSAERAPDGGAWGLRPSLNGRGVAGFLPAPARPKHVHDQGDQKTNHQQESAQIIYMAELVESRIWAR